MTITKEPVRDYEARRNSRLTSHRLGDFIASPSEFRNPKPLSKEDEKKALAREAYRREGAAGHCLTLEGPDEYARRFEIGGPINPKTGKTYGLGTKRFLSWATVRESELLGAKSCISPECDALVRRMADAVWRNSEATELLAEVTPEVTALGEYGDIPIQSRLDAWEPGRLIVEFKTVEELGQIAMQVEKYGYRRQMAFYRRLVRSITGDTLPVHLIAVEKKEPFRVEVREFTEQELNDAERENDAAIRAIQRCLNNDVWPETFDLQKELWT